MDHRNTSSRSLRLVGIGVLALIAGAYLQLRSGAVSAADQRRCETILLQNYGDSPEAKASLLPKCSEPGMVAMMDAEEQGATAQAAAQSIALANQSDIGSNALSFGLIGVGIGLLVGGIASALRAKKAT